MANKTQSKNRGFTIVELLIVIIVIAILAAITIVAYNGISNNARASAVKSELASAAKKLETLRIQDGADKYPSTLPVGTISSTAYVYAPNNDYNPARFCLQTITSGVTYYVTQATVPMVGTCADNFGIIGWWKMNGSMADSSVYARSATVTGTPTLVAGQNGQANGAYSFGGSAYAMVPTFGTNGATLSAMSISGWVYPSSAPPTHNGYFGIRTNSAEMLYTLQNSGGNVLECRVKSTTAAGSSQPSVPAITPNAWNFIALVFDGTGVTCYKDAIAGSTTSALGTFTLTDNYNFALGTNASTSYPLNGRLDDVRAYDRALSASEIQAMYVAGAQ